MNLTLEGLISQTEVGAKVLELCEFGTTVMETAASKLYTKKVDGKLIDRGVAFPVCVSVNDVVCNFSPLDDSTVSLLILFPFSFQFSSDIAAKRRRPVSFFVYLMCIQALFLVDFEEMLNLLFLCCVLCCNINDGKNSFYPPAWIAYKWVTSLLDFSTFFYGIIRNGDPRLICGSIKGRKIKEEKMILSLLREVLLCIFEI